MLYNFYFYFFLAFFLRFEKCSEFATHVFFYWEKCPSKDKNICRMIVRFVRWWLLLNIWMLRKSHTFECSFSLDIFVYNRLYLKFWRMKFINYFLLVNCSLFFGEIFYGIFRRVEKWSFVVWQICLLKMSVFSNKQNLCEMIVQFVWGSLLSNICMLEKYQSLVLFLIRYIDYLFLIFCCLYFIRDDKLTYLRK
jgi:hypothetical protein